MSNITQEAYGDKLAALQAAKEWGYALDYGDMADLLKQAEPELKASIRRGSWTYAARPTRVRLVQRWVFEGLPEEPLPGMQQEGAK